MAASHRVGATVVDGDDEAGVAEHLHGFFLGQVAHVGDLDHRRTGRQHDGHRGAARHELAGGGVLIDDLVDGPVVLPVGDLAAAEAVGDEEDVELLLGRAPDVGDDREVVARADGELDGAADLDALTGEGSLVDHHAGGHRLVLHLDDRDLEAVVGEQVHRPLGRDTDEAAHLDECRRAVHAGRADALEEDAPDDQARGDDPGEEDEERDGARPERGVVEVPLVELDLCFRDVVDGLVGVLVIDVDAFVPGHVSSPTPVGRT